MKFTDVEIITISDYVKQKFDPVMGWNHCYNCRKSFGRFWFWIKREFDQEMEENYKCPWCGCKTEIYHEKSKLSVIIMPNSSQEVKI